MEWLPDFHGLTPLQESQSASYSARAQLLTAKRCRAKMSAATAQGKGNTGQRDFTVKDISCHGLQHLQPQN